MKPLITMLLALLFPLLMCSGQQGKPNIVFILTDDQGYGDLGCHGNPWIKTPNLDLLHEESVRFTNFHVGTTCAPSRAGLLTGLYSNRVGVWHTIKGRQILSDETNTLASVLKENGYRTGIFGKWHLGDNYPFRPQDRGFEEVFVHKGGGVGQAPDFWNNDYFDDTYYRNGIPEKVEGYCTDVWFEAAMEFMEEARDKPFFCYLSLNAPHAPYHIAPEFAAPYQGNDSIPNANFYGMISSIDRQVGLLRKKLADLAIERNTIVVFMTDNGTAAGVRFDKDGQLIAGFNSGMRGTKGSPYDGGHRVPFFLHWPSQGPKKGRSINTITSYVDFMPTILELCGIPASDASFDGKSLVPLIRNPAIDWPHRYVFADTQREEFLVEGKNACIMDDRWRYLKVKGGVELYDMPSDPGQTDNIAAQQVDVVNRMEAAYDEWWSRTSISFNKYNRIKIGTVHEPEVTLSSHDCHSTMGNPAWHQEMVRKGIHDPKGFWAVEVAEPDSFRIELRRWPKESGIAVNDATPPGSNTEGTRPYPAGRMMNYREARLVAGSITLRKPVGADSHGVVFKTFLPAVEVDLYAYFVDQEGTENNAYYVYITRIDQ